MTRPDEPVYRLTLERWDSPATPSDRTLAVKVGEEATAPGAVESMIAELERGRASTQPSTVQAAQDSLDKLDQARRETVACLQGTEHGDGLNGRVGPLGLVRALVQRVNELTAELERTR
jgi:hypothetical protein